MKNTLIVMTTLLSLLGTYSASALCLHPDCTTAQVGTVGRGIPARVISRQCGAKQKDLSRYNACPRCRHAPEAHSIHRDPHKYDMQGRKLAVNKAVNAEELLDQLKEE